MGLESGRYVADLVETNPTGADYESQGDNHLRLLKRVLKSTFPFATMGNGLMYANGAAAAVSVATAEQIVAQIGSEPVGSATSLEAGTAGTVVYQAAPGVTSFASLGNGLQLTGGVLSSTFTATPYTLTGAVEEVHFATAGQTEFTLANAYTPGAGNLAVYRNGQRFSSANYTETSSTVVTLTAGVDLNDEMLFIIGDHEAGIPSTNALKVVVIGDSTTINNANLMPSWPAHFERTMQHYRGKCNVVTLAAGGLTAHKALTVDYYGGRTIAAQCIAESPAIVIIQLGAVEGLLNVDSRPLAERIQDMEDLVAVIRAGVPSAKIVYSSQLAYDSGNFTPSTLKNKGVMPWFFTLPVSGITSGSYCFDMLDEPAGASVISAVEDWEDWDTAAKALTDLDGWYTANYWRIARLGCTGSDGLHLSHYGHILLSSYATKGLRAQTWFGDLFPNFANDSAAAGEDPDLLFEGILTSDGDGYTWTQTGTGEDVGKSFGKARMLFPGSWYLPSKGNAIVPFAPTFNETSNLVFGLTGGLPTTLVELSIDGDAFADTKFTTSENGDVVVVLQAEEYSAGVHTYYLRTNNEIYGPYYLTVADETAPYSWVRVSASGQVVPANTNTVVLFDQEIADTHSNYNTSTGEWVCSKPGKYLIAATLQLAGVPVHGWVGLEILLNGSLVLGDVGSVQAINSNGSAYTAPTSASATTILDLVEGDMIRICAWSDNSVTVSRGANANSSATHCSIRWMGY